jgi:hypothetical protein
VLDFRSNVKTFVKRLVRAGGYEIIPRRLLRIEDIPPCSCQLSSADHGEFCLPKDYRSRNETAYLNDTGSSDECQWEVYSLARLIADAEGCRSVTDVGCGSGYKLLRHFRHCKTVGVDVPETVKWLRSRYPEGEWLSEDMGQPSSLRSDLVISADVIEHVLQPDQLLRYIQGMEPRLVVLSTPTRTLLRDGYHAGPPQNPCHLREWDFAEFHSFVAAYFNIVHHLVTHPYQTTQMIVCRPRVRHDLG